MTGIEVEGFPRQLFATIGYAVQTTAASGDQGFDLVLTDPTSHRVVVQAKRSSRPVSNRAVQEVLWRDGLLRVLAWYRNHEW
jgi:HJR/Mrr/RecB family endonuclease